MRTFSLHPSTSIGGSSGVRSVVSRRGPESPPFHSGPPPAPVPEVPSPGPLTAIRELPRRAGRYAVELGDARIAPVSVETIAELRLSVGALVDERAIARLLEASAATHCFDRALDALARRARATRDLERWLVQRGHPRAAVAAALERLATLGLLDDRRFAEAFVAGPARAKGFGSRRVVAELRRRGVASTIIDAVLTSRTADAGDAEGEALSAAARKRARALRSLAPEVAERRLMGWLVRRGFAPGAARGAARAALRETAAAG